MLVLLVQIAGQLYCIRASSVVEVVPRVPLQSVPHAPVSLAGLLHYRRFHFSDAAITRFNDGTAPIDRIALQAFARQRDFLADQLGIMIAARPDKPIVAQQETGLGAGLKP